MPPPKTYLVDYYEHNHLNNLKPGDYIEIQKRGRRTFPIFGNKDPLYHIYSYPISLCIKNGNHIANLFIYF
jgi:hypothetical protein